MYIEPKRLIITDFTEDMAKVVHLNSLDEDNRRFVPDEVFETVEDARETLEFLMGQYGGEEGPYVHPILLKTGENIGYVQLVPIEEGWEIGYHVAAQYTGNGYATEAVRAFLPVAAKKKGLSQIWGICVAENTASEKVMEKCGFKRVFRGIGPYQGSQREIIRNIWKKPESMILIRPTMEYEEQIRDFRREYLESGESMDGGASLRKFENIQEWLDQLDPLESEFLYVREEDRKVVGLIQIRHKLNEFLANYAGHIGYCVRPSERRKGYATQMLAKALVECERLGISDVLVCCLADNEASRKTILANGGVFDAKVLEPKSESWIERYWI